MADQLETARLLLKPFAMQDAEQIQKLFSRWEIVQYLNASIPWPYPENGAEHFIHEIALPEAARGESWFWTLRPKSAPEQIIGVISLTLKPDGNRGFWIDPAWQSQGLMTEALRRGDGLLVRGFAAASAALAESGCKRGVAAHFAETRDAGDLARREGLRWRAAAIGIVGDYSGRVASAKKTEAGRGKKVVK